MLLKFSLSKNDLHSTLNYIFQPVCPVIKTGKYEFKFFMQQKPWGKKYIKVPLKSKAITSQSYPWKWPFITESVWAKKF